MRDSLLRDRLLGIIMIDEDLPYAANRVDLDPKVRDWRGRPVARITMGLARTRRRRRASTCRSWSTSSKRPALTKRSPSARRLPSAFRCRRVRSHNEHVMGGMRMGTDPASSVTDTVGRLHGLDNLFVSDGGIFPTSDAHNPTLTIVAIVWRNATRWA